MSTVIFKNFKIFLKDTLRGKTKPTCYSTLFSAPSSIPACQELKSVHKLFFTYPESIQTFGNQSLQGTKHSPKIT